MRDLLYELDEFQRQFERMVEYFTGSRRMMSVYVSSTWRPLVDIYETADEIRVLVELPGVKREDVQLILDRNTLIIRGTRRDTFRTDCQACHQMEILFGEFERAVDIPVPVNPDGAKAIYRDGFLMVNLPKAEKPMLKRVTVTHEGDEEVDS
jgi:HSP20 family protein